MPESASPAFMTELAEQIVDAVNLDIAASDIPPDEPLFGEQGLGLDSIDILEIALVISKRYGCQLRSDDANNAKIFASLRNLAEYVAAHRSK
jgi:acyl carrier protein